MKHLWVTVLLIWISFPLVSYAFVIYNKQQKLLFPIHNTGKLAFVTPTCTCAAAMMSTDDSMDKEIDIATRDFELSTGVTMQVMSAFPSKDATIHTTGNKKKPPILFLHGSFHGAWCWAERFFAYFVSRGYPVMAPNWRGTNGTFAGKDVKKVKIMEHVADLRAILEEAVPSIVSAVTPTEKQLPPVIVCHSFGGLTVMKYLELYPEEANSRLSGVVTMCSVPPSGIGKLTMRYLWQSPIACWKITRGFAMKKCLTNDVLCRELFFGGKVQVLDDGTVQDYGISNEQIEQIQERFTRDSVATTDVFDLAKQLPSIETDDEGKARFLDHLQDTPFLVIGATHDFIVDRVGLEETATYFGLQGKYELVDSPHDIMLGQNWKNGAVSLEKWLERIA